MALSDEFEAILKETVNAKRLSASKMTTLTDMAVKNMEHDTQLVSVLYRNHKSLPTAAAKISSLYIFDALARAAKHHSTKHGLTGDAFTHPGNSASFLFKMGSVVDGLFQDMMAVRSSESKEKTRKILDIWVKGNTFPSTILSQLSTILNDVEKAPDVKPPEALTVDPRLSTQAPILAPAVSPPIVASQAGFEGLDSQAALLALLTQAAAASGNNALQVASQIGTNTGTPQIDAMATQLAVIQQLAHTAASVPPISQSLTHAESVNVQNFPSSSGVNGSSHNLLPIGNKPRTMAESKQRYSGYHSPESESRLDPHYDERDNVRGRYRGGYRNRGYGEKFQHGGDRDTRDRDRYKHTDRDQSPARLGTRGGRSRSRSPPSRYGPRKAPRHFSPPRRPPNHSQYSSGRDVPAGRDNDLSTNDGKDEFGRDIRPGSITPPSVTKDKSPSIPPNITSFTSSTPSKSPRSPIAIKNDSDISHPDQSSISSVVTANTSQNQTKASNAVSSITLGLGMDKFNPSTFDYTSPTSWESLGKMWEVTHGYLPTTEQLMQFVMSSATGLANPSPDALKNNPETNQMSSAHGGSSTGNWTESAYGSGRDFQRGGTMERNDNSTKIDKNIGAGTPAPGGRNSENQEDIIKGGPSGSSSGRMQRVGDKWVFVRGVAMDVS